jgi:hypothetical protein
MARSSTTFLPGHPGRGGRPRGSRDRVPRKLRSSVAAAWRQVTQADPRLLVEVLHAGLRSGKPREALGFLELGARLVREVGHAPLGQTAVRVIFVGRSPDGGPALDPTAFRLAAELEARSAAGELGPGDTGTHSGDT